MQWEGDLRMGPLFKLQTLPRLDMWDHLHLSKATLRQTTSTSLRLCTGKHEPHAN